MLTWRKPLGNPCCILWAEAVNRAKLCTLPEVRRPVGARRAPFFLSGRRLSLPLACDPPGKEAVAAAHTLASCAGPLSVRTMALSVTESQWCVWKKSRFFAARSMVTTTPRLQRVYG